MISKHRQLNPKFHSLKAGNINDGNYLEIEDDGTKILHGDATTWTDKSFALTRDRQGVAQKPDYDFTNRGLLFPQNDATEKVSIIDQMDHRKKFETAIRLHVHFIQTEANLPIYKIDYKFWNNGGEVPAGNTTISTADGAGALFPFVANPILQIIRFPDIALVGELISAHFEFDLYRDDNIIVGDVLTKYIDYHYEIDSDGSREEYVK